MHLVRVAHPNRAAALHGRMTFQDVLYLGRINVVTAGHNHSLDALAEVNEAFGIHHAQVAGMQPYVTVGVKAHSLGILRFVIDVAQHHRRAGETDFALLAVRQLVAGAGLANLVISIGIRDAYAPLLLFVIRCKAARRDALRGAVAFAHPDACVVV